ncbi:MAG: hypothetical protein AAGI88_23075, partial [Pseudomonadota bacterium]
IVTVAYLPGTEACHRSHSEKSVSKAGQGRLLFNCAVTSNRLTLVESLPDVYGARLFVLFIAPALGFVPVNPSTTVHLIP